jgi:hypothetical protein
MAHAFNQDETMVILMILTETKHLQENFRLIYTYLFYSIDTWFVWVMTKEDWIKVKTRLFPLRPKDYGLRKITKGWDFHRIFAFPLF